MLTISDNPITGPAVTSALLVPPIFMTTGRASGDFALTVRGDSYIHIGKPDCSAENVYSDDMQTSHHNGRFLRYGVKSAKQTATNKTRLFFSQGFYTCS